LVRLFTFIPSGIYPYSFWFLPSFGKGDQVTGKSQAATGFDEGKLAAFERI